MTSPQHWYGRGYPFGGSVLVVKSIPSRADARLGCTVEDSDGRPVGVIRPVNVGRRQRWAQFLGAVGGASWEFEVDGADGTAMLYIRRPCPRGWRDRHERFEVYDAGGGYRGRLLQNNSYLASVTKFDLQSSDAVLGHTTFDYRRLPGRFGEITAHTVTIHDQSGRIVGGIVERRTTAYAVGNDFYDYTLTFEYPPGEPLGSLCLAVVFAEYFHRRAQQGGTLGMFPGT